MPAFDPVRDAVLNSPISPSQALPFSRPGTADPAAHMQHDRSPTSEGSRPSSGVAPGTSPSLGRRATDLSMLLNDGPAPESPAPQTPLFTPTTERRGSSLSQILLPGAPSPAHEPDSKLSPLAPLARRTDSARSSSEQASEPPGSSYFSFRPSPSSSQSNLSVSPSAHPAPAPTVPNRSPPRPSSSSSMTARYDPVHAASNRPHHDPAPMQSQSRMPPPPPPAAPSRTVSPKVSPLMRHSRPPSPKRPPAPKTLPYAPKHRITPPTSVLEPLTKQDIEFFNNLRGSHRLVKKRKRIEVDFEEHEDEESRRKRSKDVGLIAGHYNARPDVGPKQRLQSPIIGLKAFNNWIKAVLIGKFAHRALDESPWAGGRHGRGRGGKVLDLGCGKGGDLTKWAKAHVAEYVGIDIAAVSIDQARSRHAGMHNASRFPAFFAALDCYAHPISDVLPPHILAPPPGRPSERPNDGPEVFDVVSMQFCMHYAFESEEKARTMLDNVSRYLRRGGVFIGTIPNAEWMLKRLLSLPPDAPPRFGNSVYTIEFDDRRPKEERPLFGDRYSFFLTDAVENVPEYVVVWEHFLRLAGEYGLRPVYKREFHQVFQEHKEHPEFGPLMVRMKVMDSNGESHMDEDQWEAANIYIAFAFEKR